MNGFIDYLKKEQPMVWTLIKQAANTDELFILDEKTDSISVTNRLLFTYPGLHEVLVRIVNQWNEAKDLEYSKFDQILKLHKTN